MNCWYLNSDDFLIRIIGLDQKCQNNVIVRFVDPCERDPCEHRQRCISKDEENSFECGGT